MQELRQQYPIASLLKLAQLPRSTFYYQQGLLRQEDKYGKLKETIKAVFERHKGVMATDASPPRFASRAAQSTINSSSV